MIHIESATHVCPQCMGDGCVKNLCKVNPQYVTCDMCEGFGKINEDYFKEAGLK